MLFLIVCFAPNLQAQDKRKDKKEKQDSLKKNSKNNTGNEFDLRNYKLDPGDRLIIEVNHTGWLNLPQGINQVTERCIGVNTQIFFDKPIGNSPFTFAYGIGIFSHNFHSNAEFIYVKDSMSNSFTTSLEPYKRPVSLNRYAQKILEIPIEFRFRTKTDRQFKIHVGGRIGYVVNDFRSIRDNDGKIRVYDIKNINPLRYGVCFRIGFEQFALTAGYYFSEIFKKGKGPNGIMPYHVGIAIIPY